MQYKFIQRPLAAIALSFAASIASAEPGLVVSNGSESITMDSSALNALPNVFFETSTIWTDGVISFSGPSLHSIIEQVGITDGELTLTAINNYVISVPVDEITETAPIVATLMNGAPLTRREKGPYWLVYPYDSDPMFQSEIVYGRSIWQLVSIVREDAE